MSEAERDIHDAGQVSILKLLHDRLDDAVADAYGWPRNLDDADIVSRVVALNAERAAEEAAGQVRWLRPDYQAPAEALRPAQQGKLAVDETIATSLPIWPKDEPGQFVVLRSALRAGPLGLRDIARQFQNPPTKRLQRMLETLVALGQAKSEEERFSA